MSKFKKNVKISLFFLATLSSGQISFSLEEPVESNNPWDDYKEEEEREAKEEKAKQTREEEAKKKIATEEKRTNIKFPRRDSTETDSITSSQDTGQTTPKSIVSEAPVPNLKQLINQKFMNESAPILEKIKKLRIQNSRSSMFELLNLDPKISYTKKEVNDAYTNELKKWKPFKSDELSAEMQKDYLDIIKNLNKAHKILMDGPDGLVTANQEEFDFLAARLTKEEMIKKINKEIDFSRPINLEALTEIKILKMKKALCQILSLDHKEFHSDIEIAKSGRKLVDDYNKKENVINKGFEKNVSNIVNLLRDINRYEEKIESSEKIIDSVASLSDLKPEQVIALHPVSISRLTASQISELKVDQIQHLSLNQIDAFSQDQINVFSDHKIEALKKRFMSLDPKEKDVKIFNDKLLSRTSKK